VNNKGLVASLFDLSFTHFITPKIQKFLYALLLLGSGVGAVLLLFTIIGMAGGFFGKVGALLVGVPAAGAFFLLLAMWFRVTMEILIVAFRAVDYLREIATSVRPDGGPSA